MTRSFFSTGWVWLWITIAVVVIDRLAKTWMVEHLVLFEPLQILPFFNFTLAHNKGAAFNFLHGAGGWQNFLFCSLAVIIGVVILIWLYKLPARERLASIALSFILGGAIGNAWDRIVYGYVIDFFDFHLGDWHFAIFNTADSAICLGVFLLLLHWVMYPK